MEVILKIYLIRHGETDWNKALRIQGRENIPLNSHGIEQAEECGRAFQKLKIDCIVSSPLIRAVQTAEEIAKYVGVKEVIIDERLIERDYGLLSGSTLSFKEAFTVDDKDANMEEWEIVSQRMLSCLYEYKSKQDIKNVIMISHGAAIKSVLTELSKSQKGMKIQRLKNACINILQDNETSFDIVSYNLSAGELWESKKLMTNG